MASDAVHVEVPNAGAASVVDATRKRAPAASKRGVSLYWPEKAVLLLQYGQLFALLWAFALAWPLPTLFGQVTRCVLPRPPSARGASLPPHCLRHSSPPLP